MTHPYQPLLDFLRDLPETGDKGFEGILRDTISELLVKNLRLVKSGPQGGVDMISQASSQGHKIGVEAKRYGHKSNLTLDQLKAKIVDAIHLRPELDLIVIGATKEITIDDQNTLIDLGEKHGMGIIIIDWPESPSLLPPLAILFALAPKPLIDHVSDQSKINSCIDNIRSHKNFTIQAKEFIQHIIKPDLGWHAARYSITQWMHNTFKNRNAALGNLGSLVNLLDPEIHRISRPKLNSALDKWLETPDVPLVLLGDEGVGKSWSPLAWWHEEAGEFGTGLPILLIIRAKDVSGTDIDGLVAQLLSKRTHIRDENFWLRRIRLWLNDTSENIRFILIFDGLNENWSFVDWHSILAQLAEDPWKGNVAVILTCRPDHWNQKLHSLTGTTPKPKVLKVEPFNDEELDGLLSLYELNRSDFIPDLLPLLKIPRLCELAIRHRNTMAESGDITRERLIYEDWKDRLGRRGANLVISDNEFKNFISKLGQELHGHLNTKIDPGFTITRGELTKELGTDSGLGPESLYETVSEIIDGRWILPIPEKPNRFIINKDLIPYTLGMALVDVLKATPDNDLENKLQEFIQPLGEQDQVVAILRSAVTVSICDPGCSTSVRETILESWISRQNFNYKDFDAFWLLMPGAPNLFFSIAENQWLFKHKGHHEDEILIKGIANAAERWPTFANSVYKWCAVWLGTHWDDPVRGMVINYDPNAKGTAERRENTILRRKEWDIKTDSSQSIPIRDGIKGNVSWLVCRILGILSYLPRDSAIPAYTAWSVSRAIMGLSPQYEQINWLLRLANSCTDIKYQKLILEESQKLVNLGFPVATDAAILLLEALAIPEAITQLEKLQEEKPPARNRRPSTVTLDEETGILCWDQNRALSKPYSKEFPLSAIKDLHKYATNPDCHLTNSDAELSGKLLDDTEIADIWKTRNRSREDHEVEDVKPILSRWVPEKIGIFYRRLFSDIPNRNGESINQYGLEVFKYLLLLTGAERQLFSSINVDSSENNKDDSFRLRLQLAALAEKPASDQIKAFLSWPDGPIFDRKYRYILTTPLEEDFDSLTEHLNPKLPTKWLCNWLWYLCYVDLRHLPKGFSALIPLINHPEHRVRQLTLEVIYKSDDKDLGKALAESSWHWFPDMNKDESINGSTAMIMASCHIHIDKVHERISPEACGHIATRDGATSEDLEIFANFVKDRIEEDLSERKSSRSFGGRMYLLEAPIDKLISKHGKDVISWVQPLLSGTKKPHLGLFLDNYPYVDISRSLLKHYPHEGVKLWRILHDHNSKGGVNVDSFFLLPFESPDSEPVLELRSEVCSRVYTDDKLMKVAVSIIDSDNQKWLIDFILKCLDDKSSGEIARGIWLAGLLDSTPEAEYFWKTKLSSLPASGWLSDVYKLAYINFQNNSWTHHWLEKFLTERNRDKAFGYHSLFLQSADRRVYAWAPKCVGNKWESLPKPWQTHWGVCWQDLQNIIKAQDNEWKNTLFGTKITTHIQWPWG